MIGVILLPWVFTFLFISLCAEMSFCWKMTLTTIVMLNLYDQVVTGKISADVQDYLLDIPRFVILLQKCIQFTLELFNNIQIGETWSWLQVISPTLTILMLFIGFIRPEGLNGGNMKCILFFNSYFLGLFLIIMNFVFKHED